jgi:hypothetical protein
VERCGLHALRLHRRQSRTLPKRRRSVVGRQDLSISSRKSVTCIVLIAVRAPRPAPKRVSFAVNSFANSCAPNHFKLSHHKSLSRSCAHCSQLRWAHSTIQAVGAAATSAIGHVIVGPVVHESWGSCTFSVPQQRSDVFIADANPTPRAAGIFDHPAASRIAPQAVADELTASRFRAGCRRAATFRRRRDFGSSSCRRVPRLGQPDRSALSPCQQ